ncbi:MAG: thioredoxin domain-containing protein [Candidatus Paceibacterota bacterium]|jgi:protein-disulfide isomerase
MNDSNKNLIIGGLSLLVIVLLVGSGVWFSDSKPSESVNQFNIGLGNGTTSVRPVDQSDHVLGNIKAPVKIIVYSDLECPYCKLFHFVLMQAYKEFGGDKLAIVYRQLPLDGLHKKARTEAQATECAAEIGGADKFWLYLDQIYNNTPSNDRLDLSLLPQFAGNIGLNVTAFKSCLDSGKYANKIAASVAEAGKIGIQGTPYPIIINPKGQTTDLGGYVSYEKLKPMIEEALKQ